MKLTVCQPNENNILKIPAFDPRTGDLNIVIETPRGSDHKYAYENDTGMFQFKKALPTGMVFPFNLGFVPSTLAADGDPLDALIITEARLFPGCLVKTRLLGAYQCEQKEKGKFRPNDRLIAVPVLETTPVKYKSLAEVDECLLRELPCRRRLALVPEFIALVPEAQREISQPHRGW